MNARSPHRSSEGDGRASVPAGVDAGDGANAAPARDRAVAAFERAFAVRPTVIARAPGRVNLMGAHVDYNGGFVLPAAIDRYVVVAARPRDDRRVRAAAVDLGRDDAFPLDAVERPEGGWRAYVRGVAALLEEAGVRLPGADIALAGDVPRGGGLSSSAALEVATGTALLALAGAAMPGPRLAALCRRAEVEWAGVSCGVMDQFVSVLGRADHALFLDCRSLEHRHVRLSGDVRIIAVDTGVRRELQESAFNERVEQCRAATAAFGVDELRDVPVDVFVEREGGLPDPVRRRARHVVHEIERTRRAAEALDAGDLDAVGRSMLESHASSRDEYETSIPELDLLVNAASAIEGVYGSRLSGAGFGGCTVSLVDRAAVAEFRRVVRAAYRAEFGRDATVYVLRAADGASVVEADEPVADRGGRLHPADPATPDP